MTARAKVETVYRSHIAEGAAPDILTLITDASIELALWRRQLPAALTQWLDSRKPDQLPLGRILVSLSDLDQGIASIVRGRSGPARPLAADIADLARRFAVIAATDLVDIRLDVIRRDACWRFHRDIVPLRLLTTYRGPGTHIPPIEEAGRALREQRAYSGPLEVLPRGTVALFKGDPLENGQGVLHRSPPVAGTDITRLLLSLNLPSAASPREWTI